LDENPIACSLGPADLGNRLAEIERIGADSLLSQRREGSTHVLSFRADAHLRQRLEAILAAERECCPFLELDLEQEGPQLVLTIAAPARAAAIAAALAERFFSR
jgi:hypothetical protein